MAVERSALSMQAMDVAQGLRALQARLRTAPASLPSNFLRAGGVSALLSLMASSSAETTQLAAASLLTTLVRKQPQAAATTFRRVAWLLSCRVDAQI